MNKEVGSELYQQDNAVTPPPAKLGWVELDGIRLRYARWHPEKNQHLGTVLICTGRNEFIEKYYETVRTLLAIGHSVVVFDWRGQGRSSRLLKNSHVGHIPDFKDYVRDFHAMFDQVLLPDCPAPYHVLAHSMGGLIALLAAYEVPQRIERMVFSAPLLKVKDLPLNEGALQTLSGIIKMLGMGGLPTYRKKDWHEITPFEKNVLTGCKARYERNSDYMRQDPEIGVGCPSVSWLNASLKAMKRVHSPEFMDNFAVPTLMVSASKDQVVSSDAIDTYCTDMTYCHHLSLQGAEHEMIQERDYIRDQFFAAFKMFIPGSKI